jgi:hypothetical protein
MTAVFSPCRRWRYRLERDLGALVGNGVVAFIMLNPSTATDVEDDPTIRRCQGFARAAGATRLLVGNLFAWRATDPRELRRCPAPVGPDNNSHLADIMVAADTVIAAWGAAAAVPRALMQPRVQAVQDIARLHGRPLHALRVTKGGAPEHPLYLPASLTPVPWSTP